MLAFVFCMGYLLVYLIRKSSGNGLFFKRRSFSFVNWEFSLHWNWERNGWWFCKASHRTNSNISFTSVALKDTYYLVSYTSLTFIAPIQSLISPIQTSFTHIQSYSHVLL